ncbi:HNH endonuclease signature motif containing protein [Nocardia sp. NPDC051463]|uniref:HNH endonuclease n=1 Tax=Nocardia sp. NPDC051463 TaxID=3154845 RepID=UPI00344F07F1
MVRVRKGQDKFRESLLQRDGLVCAVTGPCPAKALEAAHLRAFATHGTHDPDEGLLLRADIHSLFDAGLIAVDPTTMKVVVAPALKGYPGYAGLQDVSISPGPFAKALADHHQEVASAWA